MRVSKFLGRAEIRSGRETAPQAVPVVKQGLPFGRCTQREPSNQPTHLPSRDPLIVQEGPAARFFGQVQRESLSMLPCPNSVLGATSHVLSASSSSNWMQTGRNTCPIVVLMLIFPSELRNVLIRLALSRTSIFVSYCATHIMME